MLLVLLCDAVAQGIIQPWCGTSGSIIQEGKRPRAQSDRTKKNGKKRVEKSGSTHAIPLEAAAVQNIKKALQVRTVSVFILTTTDFTSNLHCLNLQLSHSIVPMMTHIHNLIVSPVSESVTYTNPTFTGFDGIYL